ncbi:MAG: FMN-binding negative transcriptional regulator [Sphingobium sp.]|uniref:FMN-binding negative transcriptional regulator n=1 Tax=Sphingobium sp. TaxID=1912891 RepID=UPI0029BD864B|nr:FMN-binding negative transcriptional regulator [Sphingobium sp.]MDX3908345.1 FMN-binding negative transcriptional regulator [Sphingobium sp.]
MHPDKTFAWTDRTAMRGFVEQVGLGAIFAATPEGLRVAHAPVLFLSDDCVGFHLSRHSPLAAHLMDGDALFVAQGPHAYVSPDWYGMEDQVPTWNYVAVELEGHAKAMDRERLVALIDAISARHEARLAPKKEWTREKMRDGLFDRMLGGIIGCSFTIREWRGTMKIGQNKPEAARLSVAAALVAQGEHDMAALMQGAPA